MALSLGGSLFNCGEWLAHEPRGDAQGLKNLVRIPSLSGNTGYMLDSLQLNETLDAALCGQPDAFLISVFEVEGERTSRLRAAPQLMRAAYNLDNVVIRS